MNLLKPIGVHTGPRIDSRLKTTIKVTLRDQNANYMIGETPMPYREIITQMKVKTVLEVAKEEYEFPKLLRTLRRLIRQTRRAVSEDTLIPPHRIEYLETGKFNRMPEEDEFLTLGAYFGVPGKLLKKKAKQYLEKKHDVDSLRYSE